MRQSSNTLERRWQINIWVTRKLRRSYLREVWYCLVQNFCLLARCLKIYRFNTKTFCEELIAYFLSTRQRRHRNQRIHQFLYCSRANKFTERNFRWDIHTDTQTDRRVYDVRHWDGLKYFEIYTKFYKVWFRHSNVDGEEDTHTHTHTRQ